MPEDPNEVSQATYFCLIAPPQVGVRHWLAFRTQAFPAEHNIFNRRVRWRLRYELAVELLTCALDHVWFSRSDKNNAAALWTCKNPFAGR